MYIVKTSLKLPPSHPSGGTRVAIFIQGQPQIVVTHTHSLQGTNIVTQPQVILANNIHYNIPTGSHITSMPKLNLDPIGDVCGNFPMLLCIGLEIYNSVSLYKTTEGEP